MAHWPESPETTRRGTGAWFASFFAAAMPPLRWQAKISAAKAHRRGVLRPARTPGRGLRGSRGKLGGCLGFKEEYFTACGAQYPRGWPVEKLLDIAEAASLLGVKPQTLYLWVSQKRIAYRKIGRLVRFRMSDLEEFVDQVRQPIVEDHEHL
jgi:excisionase family DNA binding protein